MGKRSPEFWETHNDRGRLLDGRSTPPAAPLTATTALLEAYDAGLRAHAEVTGHPGIALRPPRDLHTAGLAAVAEAVSARLLARLAAVPLSDLCRESARNYTGSTVGTPSVIGASVVEAVRTALLSAASGGAAGEASAPAKLVPAHEGPSSSDE